MKVKWKVSDKPRGPYRSFEVWQWPMLWDDKGRPIMKVVCEDAYTPARGRGEQSHDPLQLYVADYRPESNPSGRGFQWRRVKRQYATLEEAKAGAQRILDAMPELFKEADL